jgi:tRNA pseudouridine55 synthase
MLKVNPTSLKFRGTSYDQINSDDDVVVVDKQAGWTSHDVVAKIRGELSRKYGKKIKVGHGGTLDPFATGLLLILIGKACSRFEEFKGLDKEYVMEIKLGQLTDTGDKTGKVIEEKEVGRLSRVVVEKVLDNLVGEYDQQVPIYSAVKVKGQKLYDIARKQKEPFFPFSLPVRRVKIMQLELLDLHLAVAGLKVRVKCGSGTYMRSLAVDIGKKLKLPAHAKELKRTKVGEYSL